MTLCRQTLPLRDKGTMLVETLKALFQPHLPPPQTNRPSFVDVSKQLELER